jgi:hypothetical protein
MVDDQSIYVVETASNSIAQYDLQGRLIEKRSFSDQTDSWQINRLGKWRVGSFSELLAHLIRKKPTKVIQTTQDLCRICTAESV